MKTTKFVLLSLTLLNFVATNLITSQAAFAGTPTSDCINSLLYTAATSTSNPRRTQISEQTASKVCGGVKTEQESQSVQSCFNSLLYTAATSTSNPRRTETSYDVI
jgi:hypothetical protein